MVKITKLLSDSKRGIKVSSSRDYISLSRKGLTMNQLKQILKFTNINIKQLAQMLSISERQLSRYTLDKILKTDVSAHLIQIAELYEFGYSVFDIEADFQEWMNSEIRALSYQKPIDLLDTPFGINNVKNILGRLEYGVFS
ncbi:MAG: putative toxin-antitoxin system antitoxin component (TIGR02293 family) [Polaribacter sp.]|jgi:putative toxin-antitoxin system antitoxin component (TIGR02293 family)